MNERYKIENLKTDVLINMGIRTAGGNFKILKNKNMFTDISMDNNYPKTLVIRNHSGGLVWQIYHVQTEREAEILSSNATAKGFEAITLEDYQPKEEETWPDWRETEGGRKITGDI